MDRGKKVVRLFDLVTNVQTIILLSAFLKEKFIYMIKYCNENNLRYFHLLKIGNQLERLGVIRKEIEGRRKRVYLTENGKEILDNIIKLKNYCDEISP